ncbi:DNA-directed RNA polymerase III subunit RPC2 [Capsicum annuum]|uniref:DNA-directed RNA polymerase n=1 Tax=Capsicum annuum TaxID=4072 RepID=A0A2G2Y0U4_CAPAN|nr:DNA-directed RNA polymerase III subunit RPC2 [Capsicum annuum]PHT63376.1 DNA-directed RNA polymerase III subunit RPC2 [Capsicum annuum]
MEKEKIYLELNMFKTKVPIMVVMKAMGMESDQKVVQMIGRDTWLSALLLPSIKECADLKLYTQQQALEFLESDKMLKMPLYSTGPVEKGTRALSILRDIFLANVPVHQHNFRKKCIYVAVMMRRMMEAILNKDAMDDKDCGEQKIGALQPSRSSRLDISQYIVKDYITQGLERTLSTGNWDVKRFRMHRKGMTQFGMLCPCDTPEGEVCGLVENLALMTHVTTDEDERPIMSLRCVYIASDGGRVCRPLVIADKGVSRIKEHHMRELRDGVRDFDSFLRDGLIEYLDVNEENNTLIALYEKDATPETTHIEIEPFTILGVCAGLIPYPHHNQSPRNTYQCAMVELVGYDKLGAGQNATVAVMSYSGYDTEDAMVMNKSSLDRGLGRCIVMKKYAAICQTYENGTSDRIIKPQRQGYETDRMQILDDDGLAAPGEIIRPHDIYINKESPTVTRTPVTSPMGWPDSAYKPSRQTYKGPEGETAVIGRVALYSDRNNNLSIKFMIRHTRRPEIGDKFSSRHGQKGVCGTIVQQEDFPFSERGICPDLIMNPHGFPSRMTVGKMIELLGSKAGVSCGRFHYGSAFG